MRGVHEVVGGRMVKKVWYMKQGEPAVGERLQEVRASIVARRLRNGRGAKGSRKVNL